MIFNKNKYPILDDVGDKGVLLSPGASRAVNDLKKEAKEVEEIFGVFCDKIIINCEKGYYLSKKINDTLSEDVSVQEKLNVLLHELESTQGIMLLPKFKYSHIFNSFAYYIDKNDKSKQELNFSISFHGMRGLEIFISGTFIKNKFKSLSFVADDLEFYIDTTLVFEILVNYVFNILLFMQFAEVETVITEGKSAKGKSKIKFNNEKIINDSNLKIEVIDSNWFKRLIRTGAFKVNGHFRMQPYGIQNSLRKLIWIEEFTKTGYKITPKVLKEK
jgi:hypothetical protein